MTRYRSRAALLLFLVLNLTACQTWQSVSLDAISPAQVIEEDQPDRVRVTMQDRTQMELERPVVDGDELVAPGGLNALGRHPQLRGTGDKHNTLCPSGFRYLCGGDYPDSVS